jgi:hypothetical protein
MIDRIEYEDQPQSPQHRQNEPDENLRMMMISGGDYLNLDSIFQSSLFFAFIPRSCEVSV